jgi:hypothetical protein
VVDTISGRKELGIYKYLSIIDIENIFNQKLFYLKRPSISVRCSFALLYDEKK